MNLRSTQRKTLDALFEKPERADIAWDDIISLLSALGAEISQGRGSRVWIALNGRRAIFHRPHPRKETDKGAVKDMKAFLEYAGIRREW